MTTTLERAKAIIDLREQIESAEPRDRIELARRFCNHLEVDGLEIVQAFVALAEEGATRTPTPSVKRDTSRGRKP